MRLSLLAQLVLLTAATLTLAGCASWYPERTSQTVTTTRVTTTPTVVSTLTVAPTSSTATVTSVTTPTLTTEVTTVTTQTVTPTGSASPDTTSYCRKPAQSYPGATPDQAWDEYYRAGQLEFFGWRRDGFFDVQTPGFMSWTHQAGDTYRVESAQGWLNLDEFSNRYGTPEQRQPGGGQDKLTSHYPVWVQVANQNPPVC